jgi:hypothetical protein
MDSRITSTAFELRRCIEMRSDGDITAPAVLNLVSQLGGNSSLIPELAGKPALVAVYLISLVLTQPDGPRY